MKMKKLITGLCSASVPGVLLLAALFLVLGCKGNDSTDKAVTETPLVEPEQPPEADLFSGLTLTQPLKGYNDHNPLMTQDFGADPNVLVSGDRVYLYMTADSLTPTTQAPSGQGSAQDYGYIKSFRVISSTDLVNWTQHPEIKISDLSGTKSFINNTWAPALASKNNKVYLYFSNGGGATAVISADNPLGPWTSPRTSNIFDSSTPGAAGVTSPFDPGVLVDDDGQAYLYAGGGTPSGLDLSTFPSIYSNPDNIRVYKLNDDMISLDTSSCQHIAVPFSFEDSEINKINGRYYYSYCTKPSVMNYTSSPNATDAAYATLLGGGATIAYASSSSPMGPFTLLGTVLPNPSTPLGLPYVNNHHKIFQFKNRWYIAYHTKLLLAANPPASPPSGSSSVLDWYYRSTSIDVVSVLSNGQLVTQSTKSGVQQLGNFDPYDFTSAATMAVEAGISTTPVPGDTTRMKVTSINSGDWIALHNVDFGSTGATKFYCTVTPPAAAGNNVIQIRLDGVDGMRIGYVTLEPGQTTYTVDLLQPQGKEQPITGVHDLVFVFCGSGYDFEQWQFVN